MAKTETVSSSTDSETRYEVVKGSYGDYPFGGVFSESAFKARHPVPQGTDEKEYHDALLLRGITLGVIIPTDKKSTPVESGTLNPLAGSTMDAIRTSQAESQKAAADRKAISDADLAARSSSDDKK